VTKIDLFKAYTEDNDEWKKNLETRRKGLVTGVINTAKKCGVFVELPELNITGLVSLKSDELVNYKPGDEVDVRIVSFDEIRYYDKDYDQVRHAIPYVITDNLVKECNLKPVLQFA
jgi:exoribonuclease R